MQTRARGVSRKRLLWSDIIFIHAIKQKIQENWVKIKIEKNSLIYLFISREYEKNTAYETIYMRQLRIKFSDFLDSFPGQYFL